jgi:hypothetical protein
MTSKLNNRLGLSSIDQIYVRLFQKMMRRSHEVA